MTRYEANKKILEILNQWVEKYPEDRFGQILAGAKVVQKCFIVNEANHQLISDILQDEFYLESERLLNRLQEAI